MLQRVDVLLLLTIFLPLIGAAMVWVLDVRGRSAVRQSALVTTLITFVMAAYLIYKYLQEGAVGGVNWFAVYDFNWLGAGASSEINVRFSVGLDGLSLWMFGLSALLTVTAVLVSWEAIEERPAAFYGLLLMLETGMLGVFTARDIILFYIFFEFTLIPLFFLIGIWGSEERRYAAMKFFLFTLGGSLLTFLGLLSIVLWVQSQTGGVMSFSIPELIAQLQQHPIPNGESHGYMQMWIFLALFAGFAIKVPLFPLHTWLPLAHVQAPTAGSVILAGVLLKIGTYGFVRFCFPMLPEATAMATPWMLWLAVAGIIYGALVALAQADIKRLIAYSSVSHLGFVMLGIFALNRLGMQGGVLQMVNHGISTGGLFATFGMLYERYHTRQIKDLSGLASATPLLTLFMIFFTFTSIGLPGLNGFTGEFMILAGMFQRGWTGAPEGLGNQLLVIAVIAVFGVVLGAWYMLWLVQRVFFGPLREPTHEGHAVGKAAPAHGRAPSAHGHVVQHGPAGGEESHGRGASTYADATHRMHDMTLREVLALAPLVILAFWIGLYPKFFLDPIAAAVDPMTEQVAAEFDQEYSPVRPVAAVPSSPESNLTVNK